MLTLIYKDPRKESNSYNESRKTPPRIESPTIVRSEVGPADNERRPAASTNAQPLAPPPPRPQQQSSTSTAKGTDYFSQPHNNSSENNSALGNELNGAVTKNSHLQLEPNPFEQSFGNPSTETPGKLLLPSVASLTSPASLLQGGTPGWSNSLRSGPLSPAMLAGPTGNDYFSEHFRGGFPTPNESSLRTGLTPGGGGSMFPAPSPNTQALFTSLHSAGATPNTIDFQRSALVTVASSKPPLFNVPPSSGAPIVASSTVPVSLESESSVELKPPQPSFQMPQPPPPPQSHTSANQQDPFGQHDTDAANGLYMLANANGNRGSGSFAVPPQPNHVTSNLNQPRDASPTVGKRTAKNSIGSISGSIRGVSESGDYSESGHSEQAKPTTRSRGKKGGTGNTNFRTSQTGNRRKAEDTTPKGSAPKRARGVSVTGMSGPEPDFDYSDDSPSPKQDSFEIDVDNHTGGGNGNRKMTDEEKRRNFLERNRVAALKCRQRKKQWLANLQAKVEVFSSENDALSTQVSQLREEIVNLKTLLIAHKDCPVAQAQGLSGLAMQAFLGDIAAAAVPSIPPNPFGLGLHHPPNSQQHHTGLGLPVPGPGAGGNGGPPGLQAVGPQGQGLRGR